MSDRSSGCTAAMRCANAASCTPSPKRAKSSSRQTLSAAASPPSADDCFDGALEDAAEWLAGLSVSVAGASARPSGCIAEGATACAVERCSVVSVGDWGGRAAAVQQDDALKGWAILPGQQIRVIRAEEIRHGEGQLGPGAAHNVRRLAALEAGVDGHQHTADLLAGQGPPSPTAPCSAPRSKTAPPLASQWREGLWIAGPPAP